MNNKEKRAEQRELIDKLGVEWKSISKENNEADYRKIFHYIWLEATEYFKQKEYHDVFTDAILEAEKLYDPQKGSLTSFLQSRLNLRLKDKKRKEKTNDIIVTSLNNTIYEDNETELIDVLEDNDLTPEQKTVQLENIGMLIVNVTAQIINFASNHHGKQANNSRLGYFRMFYTADMTKFIKEEKDISQLLLHMRDMLSVMHTEFLDYYMVNICRKIQEIADSPLKPYCNVVPNRSEQKPIPLPIPLDVYGSYINVTTSAVSQQRKTYENEIRDAICRDSGDNMI